MFRSSFVLAVTLLVVAGSLAFMISFDRDHGDTAGTSSGHANHPAASASRSSSGSRQEAQKTRSSRSNDIRVSLPKSTTSHLDNAQLVRVNDILSSTRREAREKLDKLSSQYKLTAEQRRKTFPLIVAHHDQAHPAMTINGQSLPAIAPASTLNDSLASVFDSSQQDELIEVSADHDAWWEDVVGQLEVDLDTAIDNGEANVTAEDAFDTGVIPSDQPAAGDGEASGHSGGNLFDLLGQ
ncbi:MAG: hypothetical protein ACJAVK_000861 [Akkermansiaceae bacterium]|jgi:hypothetical protein